MQRATLLATGLLAVSLCTSGIPAFAVTPATLPPAQTQGSVTYRSGGIGHDEAQAFAAAASQYPLTLEFAVKHRPRAEFTAGVHVLIKDAHDKLVLDTQSDGPFLLAKLPTGFYTVTAEWQQQTHSQRVHVNPPRPAHVLFLWAA
jgi:hypothetical protein